MDKMNLYLVIALAPLGGSLLAGLLGKVIGRKGAHIVTILGVAISFVLSCGVLYDFWTGKRIEGGQTVKAEAPLDQIPLFVKAGSIVPVGPVVQHSGEKSNEELEIRIYEGANGEFTLYEDEGDNYNYEKGMFSTITFTWNDAKKTLTIADRKGSFSGMLGQRKFNLVLVDNAEGKGMDTSKKPNRVVDYKGEKISIKLN